MIIIRLLVLIIACTSVTSMADIVAGESYTIQICGVNDDGSTDTESCDSGTFTANSDATIDFELVRCIHSDYETSTTVEDEWHRGSISIRITMQRR